MMLNGERYLALLYSTASRFSTFKVIGTPFAAGSCDGQKAPLRPAANRSFLPYYWMRSNLFDCATSNQSGQEPISRFFRKVENMGEKCLGALSAKIDTEKMSQGRSQGNRCHESRQKTATISDG
jgi:hypothetical protein